MEVRTFLISPATNKNQILDSLYNAQVIYYFDIVGIY